MSINVFQAILIGLWTAFCFSGMLLEFTPIDVLFCHLVSELF